MTKLSPARRFALGALIEAERSHRFVRDVAECRPRPADARDAALGLRLALGVTATRGCLDELLDRFLAKPGSVALPVRAALRVAAFEIMYLGTAPAVAVSQGVELVRSRARSAAGLANAVLRRVAAACAAYRAADDVAPGERDVTARARAAGLPVWLAREIEASCGLSAASGLFAAELEPAPMTIHLNPLSALSELAQATALPGCVAPASPAAYIATGALTRGEAVASDASAQLIATAATAPGSCLEIGAGRGTKTFIMMATARRAGWARTQVAAELSPEKVRANQERLQQAGLAEGVSFITGDCCELDAVLAPVDQAATARQRFDTVFVDAPCSGTGTMRRHPEIPWRLASDDVSHALPELQLALLSAAATRVAPAGQLIYATCSVLAQENAQVIEAFLASPAGAGFALAPVSDAPIFSLEAYREAAAAVHAHEDGAGRLQTVPAPGEPDGHFCARLVRA